MGQFKAMPKMKTTEPSVELKLKKGGKVKKQMGGSMPMVAPQGGNLPVQAMPTAPARRGMPMRRGMPAQGMAGSRGLPPAALLRKKGGAIEGKAEDVKEEREIKGIKNELKSHESMKASKAHKGLKSGGSAPKAGPNVMGGLLGGIEATRSGPRGKTGQVSGYKKGGLPKSGIIKSETGRSTISGDANPKHVGGKTGVIHKNVPAGFKRGGKMVKC